MNVPGNEQADPVVPRQEVPPPGRARWLLHLLLLGAYPVVLGFLGLTRYANRGPALTHSSRGLVFTCAFHLVLFGIIFGLAWLASRAFKDDLLLRWRPGLLAVPLGIGYSVALRFAVGMVAVFLFTVLVLARVITPGQAQAFARDRRPDVTTLVDLPALRHDPVYFWLTVTFVSFVVAGLREELWRAGFLAGLKKLWPAAFGSRHGQVAAVAVTSLVFGLGHLPLGPMGVGAATLLGFGLGMIMVLHKSIWPAVIAHGMFDATTFALLPWAVEWLKG